MVRLATRQNAPERRRLAKGVMKSHVPNTRSKMPEETFSRSNLIQDILNIHLMRDLKWPGDCPVNHSGARRMTPLNKKFSIT